MRIIGWFLILSGVLSLGLGSISYPTREILAESGALQVRRDREKVIWIPPVFGGIVLVTGLIMLVTTIRRE